MDRWLRTLAAAVGSAGVTVAFACKPPAPLAENTAPLVSETEVVMYEPSVPSGPHEKGACWSSSIAVLRAGAWRCTVGNLIHDPCFSIRALHRAVVCGADPATAKPGFVMELAKPLPDADLSAQVKPEPWLMRLADGTVCEKMTGTVADIDGVAVPWGCNDSRANPRPGEDEYYSGVLENLRRGKVWMANKVRYAPTRDPAHPLRVLKRQTVAVRTVWE
ncbi:MAG TPA: hypothetical protein VFB33_07720 [Candidatus Binataceae bacterium]|jgi:hypothetical protein|nr:hypothetical protein [Candidatus Binataceae bacterium]